MTTDALCVYCRRQAVDPTWRPFCSERCKLLDLRNWVDERYRVPGETTSFPDDPDADDGDSRGDRNG